MIRALGFIIGFAIGFVRGVVDPINKPQHPLVDPPLPCGECDLETNTCPCLETLTDATSLYLHRYGIEGYTVDQLHQDIEALEHQS
jgi:hypothetical protein